MNRSLFTLAATLLVVGFVAHCTQFPTRYERIEPDALRSIGFTYEPYAEAAPGDTLTVRAYFGGEKVVSVEWTWSTDHVIDGYGTDTVLNITALPVIGGASRLPDSAEVSFVIPDSVFFTTRGLSPRVYGAARAALPPGMASMPQQEHAAFLADLMAVDPSNPAAFVPFIDRWGAAMGVSTLDDQALATILSIGGTLLRAFSAPAVLYATVTSETGKTLKIKGDFFIRYNRKLVGTPFSGLLPVNRNPAIRWIGVYSVKGKGLVTFNPADPANADKFTLTYLYNELFPDSVRDTIDIDTGHSYFFAADSGNISYTLPAGTRVVASLSGSDTTWRILDADSVIADTSIDTYIVPVSPDSMVVESETWRYDWQYQNLDLDSVTKPLDSLFMLAGRGGTWIVGALPSLDPTMTHARIWVTVRDFFIDFNRPTGITIRTCDVHFRYSDAYRTRRR
ncbi:MAG: hypothetical protein JXA71_03660 [Chitinispirillaceae bacterium]|nr:hypothetical protein [Chitinispirillaceae bacterium]